MMVSLKIEISKAKVQKQLRLNSISVMAEILSTMTSLIFAVVFFCSEVENLSYVWISALFWSFGCVDIGYLFCVCARERVCVLRRDSFF
mmetsp:Transcript_19337/g.28863  ORF Transcript_19337/g.28863 Transcript_19337/m.28863 type:complete len:89 (-) Transcript_19337:365-631(-)